MSNDLALNNMKEFLSGFGLYKVSEFSPSFDNLYYSPFDFQGETFDYYCTEENDVKTFEIELEETYNKLNANYFKNKIPEHWIKEGKLNYVFQADGKCKSCGKIRVQFLINIFKNSLLEKDEIDETYFIQKVGVIPQVFILPNPVITKYFGRESNIWYYKGINAINDNYGIGAMAYFRRIIEKELLSIIDTIKELPDTHTEEIQTLIDKHNANPTMSSIYENILKYLPSSLKDLGGNPIELLYTLTSKALHSMSEKESIEKAKSILHLLDFVILKINEEKSEIQSIKDTIKALK